VARRSAGSAQSRAGYACAQSDRSNAGVAVADSAASGIIAGCGMLLTASQEDQRPLSERSALREIGGWGRRYVQSHPLLSLHTVGGQVVLGIRTVQYLFVDLFARRFPVGEFVRQAAFMAGTAVVPTLLVTIPVGVTLAIQFSVLAEQVGADSLAGAANGLVVIRQGAPLVAAILLAAAVGSAVAADLGSRMMREEIDAMEVMGVSAIRRLVVPRFVAVIVVGVALTGSATFAGFVVGYLFNVYLQDGVPGSFVATFSAFATVDDFVLALVKAIIFGAIVAIVSCHKGLDTHGGPAGVANSVNAAVVESILLLMAVNVALSQLYFILFPRTSL
jgi:phospholipid/cholesterol/gamma-HCH transport system permease protein